MADWPALAELKQVLNVDSDDWDVTLTRVLAAAVREVKSDRGAWDDNVDAPDVNLAQAALRMAELMASRPEATDNGRDPAYQRLMFGHRRKFGVG